MSDHQTMKKNQYLEGSPDGKSQVAQSLKEIASLPFKIIAKTQAIVGVTKTISKIIGTSKGRDLLCSTIQYSAKLVYNCSVHSNITRVMRHYE